MNKPKQFNYHRNFDKSENGLIYVWKYIENEKKKPEKLVQIIIFFPAKYLHLPKTEQ